MQTQKNKRIRTSALKPELPCRAWQYSENARGSCAICSFVGVAICTMLADWVCDSGVLDLYLLMTLVKGCDTSLSGGCKGTKTAMCALKPLEPRMYRNQGFIRIHHRGLAPADMQHNCWKVHRHLIAHADPCAATLKRLVQPSRDIRPNACNMHCRK